MKRKILSIVLIAAFMLPGLTIPVSAATQGQINQAIQDGLTWLATQQNGDGSFGSGYSLANTATAVLAFENEGHFPGGGTAYSTNVEKGLDYIFTRCNKISINPQGAGNPDTNGNGQGVYFGQSSYMYETGLVMQAIAASNTSDRVVGGTSDFSAIAAGGYHSLALKADGSIVGWGNDGYGQTNVPAGNDYLTIAAGGYHSLAIKADGSIVGWGANWYGQTNVPAGNDYVAIAAGLYHSLALKADGSIVGWGSNGSGQANAPAGNDFVAIAAGMYHNLALKADGSIVGWGSNGSGQANAPAGNDFVAIAAGGYHSLAIKADGSIVGWGANWYGQTNVPAGNDYLAIAAGIYHSLALKADGSIIGWGSNGYGQANAPAGNDYVAIAAGADHNLALKADGSIVGWGYNGYGQATRPFGMCVGMTYQEVMTDLVDFIAWAQIDGGLGRGGWRYDYYNNVATYADNSVSQWPVLGLVAAEQWGISAPQWVKDELEYWVTYIQNADGGSGYYLQNDGGWGSNMSRTGGLLVEFYYLGDDATTLRVQRALNYVNNHWNDGLGGWDGNKGHPYAMFSVFKGLELLQVPTIPNAPANSETPVGDWWGDYSDYLVDTQSHPGTGLGYWGGYYYWNQYLATPWYIVILQATVFPVSVDVIVPGAACDLTGYEVNVTYSVERFNASGTLKVYRDDVLYDTVTLTDFIGSATVTYNLAPETVGDHIWRAELDVTTGSGISTHAEDTDTGSVYATPQVAGIPDQVSPFQTFDLDDFQTCDCDDVEWAASGVPLDWTVTIDEEHVVTVVAPEGAYEPAEITFTAVFHWPEIDCEDSDTAVFSPNQPPVAHPGKIYPNEKYYVDEGGSVLLDGSQSYDPDGDTIISYAWDLDNDGTFEAPGATTIFSAASLDGPSEVYVFLKVCDEHSACSIGQAEVEIENVAPTIDAINAPLDPVNISNPVNVEVFFSDPGVPDTHDITVTWGDSSSETRPGVTSPVSASHNYASPGVYEITVTVTDDDGGSDTQVYQYVVVYDPSAGFVTGGGWIESPVGAYKPDTSLSGKANFGFVSKYKKGITVPTGNTEFQFHAAGLNFHSDTYNWLVVTGSNYAMFKGVGTINGMGEYKFMIWAGDNSTDTFRIKIWEEDEYGFETVIYDNGKDQPIGGGSIVIHTKK